jgi:hypothetical protein
MAKQERRIVQVEKYLLTDFFYTEFIVFTRLPPLWRDSASGLMVNIQIMSGLAGFTCLYRQVGISSVCIYFI